MTSSIATDGDSIKNQVLDSYVYLVSNGLAYCLAQPAAVHDGYCFCVSFVISQACETIAFSQINVSLARGGSNQHYSQ